MPSQRPIPDPPPGYHLRDYEYYGQDKMQLHNDAIDGPRDGHQIIPSKELNTVTRLVEGDFLPIADRETQQREKRCAELCDKFLATATVDDDNSAENKSGKGSKGKTAQKKNKTKANNPQNNPNNDPNNNNNNNDPPTTLHIPTTEFHEFANLLHQLSTPPPRPPTPPPPPINTVIADLSTRETLLAARATALGQREVEIRQRENVIKCWESGRGKRMAEIQKREATAALLYNEEGLARHLEGVWRMGYRKARGELGLGGGDVGEGDDNIGASAGAGDGGEGVVTRNGGAGNAEEGGAA